ncbi:TPA: aldehyde dehydrogenase family protein [Staphylococcus aureus]|nr:aldehyde dehydrogenase family protein [Staphylococcus aureus]
MLTIPEKENRGSKEQEVAIMIDALADKGKKALEALSKKSQEEIDHIVHQMSLAAVDQHMVLAKLAHEETGRGIYEDKAIKNLYASEYIWNSIKDNKTVGIIGEDKEKGLTYVAEPIGVICGVTPTTNPTSTTIFKAMIAIKTGNPIIFAFHPSAQESSKRAAEVVLEAHRDKINHSDVLNKLGLEPQQYILVSAHREENIDNEKNFKSLMNAINDIAKKYKMPVIYSTHPRSWKKIEESKFEFDPLVKQLKPFGFFDYNALQKDAFVVLSDSGTLSEESSILKFPGVLIRTSTERPEVLDKGTVIVGGITYNNLIQSVELAREMQNNNEPMIDAIDYKDTNVSTKVVKIIQSYKDIINRNTWRK